MDRKQLELPEECRQLMGKCRTLVLATSAEDGEPDASVVPYLLNGGGFVIFVSELARHTAHLLGTKRCTALFLQDEKEATNVFARKRLTIGCRVVELDRGAPQSERILEEMAVHFGPVVEMLRQLPDFHLLRLEPLSCNYVRGFGQAFRFVPSDHPGMWSSFDEEGVGAEG